MTASTDIISPDGMSIPDLFRERVRRSPEAAAYRFFDRSSETWVELTWRRTAELVARWRAALKTEPLAPGDRVAVMLPNGMEWVGFDIGALSLGLVVVPLYANDRPDSISYILKQTGAKVLLCLEAFFHGHLEPRLQKLDSLQRIITVPDPAGAAPSRDPRHLPLDGWLPGPGEPFAATALQPDGLATIVYTSGTTGRPKGVMLSHRNMLENAAAGLSCIAIRTDDLLLSFLPLSHMLERTAGYYLPMMAGSTVAFARSIPDLPEDLNAVRPTVLVAVPRIFEKLLGKLQAKLGAEPVLKRRLFEMAADIGWRSYLRRQGRGARSPDLLLQPLLDRLVGAKVRERLGGRLRIIISGGAPLAFPVARTLIGLGLPIYQGYGLTETSPIISVNRVEDNRPEGVGRLLPGIEARLGDHGELHVRGPNVMLGYWRNPEATDAVIEPDGWLHTGDTAAFETDHLLITGRLKEILVLSNGEKIAPTDVEGAIARDPLFEQTLVVGEGRPYLTLLAVLNAELWNREAHALGVSADESSLTDERVRSAMLRRVERCLQDFPGYAWIRDIRLSLAPWTIEQGLLTPTMKMRRKKILSSFEEEIESMYPDEAAKQAA